MMDGKNIYRISFNTSSGSRKVLRVKDADFSLTKPQVVASVAKIFDSTCLDTAKATITGLFRIEKLNEKTEVLYQIDK